MTRNLASWHGTTTADFSYLGFNSNPDKEITNLAQYASVRAKLQNLQYFSI